MMRKSDLALAISAAIDVQRQASLDDKRRQFIASMSSQLSNSGRRMGKTWLRAQGVKCGML